MSTYFLVDTILTAAATGSRWVYRTVTDRKQIRDIVGLQLERVKRIAHGQGLTVEFDDSLIDHLADVGYRPEFGARELRRQIRSLIETRLASAVLRGDIEEGDSLRFVYDKGRSDIRWEKEAKVPASEPE